MSRWYRAYEGTVTDAKLAEVAMVAGCSRSVVIATWHACLENAANVNDGGRIDIPSRRIAAVLCEPFVTIEGVMLGFETVGLLLDSVITSWKRLQYESDSSTERSRKHREAKRNGHATLQQQHATPPETETEILEEEDKSSPSRRVRAQKPQIEVPDWIPKTAWDGWIEMRRLKHAKPSPHAITLAIGELEKLRRDGHDPGAVLDQSTLKNWTGLFPIKEQSNVKRPDNDGLGRTGRAMLAVENQLRQAGHH